MTNIIRIVALLQAARTALEGLQELIRSAESLLDKWALLYREFSAHRATTGLAAA